MIEFDSVSLGLCLGYAGDTIFGDPRRWHPVAGFGRAAAALERRLYKPSRTRGALVEVLLVGVPVLAGVVMSQGNGPLEVAVVAVSTWLVLGGRSLRREAHAMERLLDAHDLTGARSRISNLVGRDPSALDAPELARACVESVAENGADAVVSPLFWGAVAGIPGLLGYRAANTLDAMFGHRTPRLREFGWAAARFDDVLNWIPARLTVLVTAAATGSPRSAAHVLSTVRRDAPAHPSPNAGPVEAAFAGAMGRQLGGRNVYAGDPEERGLLGTGPAVQAADIARAIRLQRRIGVIGLFVIVGSRLAFRAVT